MGTKPSGSIAFSRARASPLMRLHSAVPIAASPVVNDYRHATLRRTEGTCIWAARLCRIHTTAPQRSARLLALKQLLTPSLLLQLFRRLLDAASQILIGVGEGGFCSIPRLARSLAHVVELLRHRR